VGANIGLMAVPILAKLPTVNILSCEPSPNILPFLRRTIRESGHSGRWHLVEKAAGRAPGRIDFHLGPVAESELDGIRHTRRAPLDRIVEVEMTSLDAEWQRLGKPDVSIVKIDVEGGELGVLEGSQALLQAARPHVILEWHQENLLAYDCPASALIEFAERMHYQIFALPRLTKVHGDADLRVHMLQTENFLLLP
jgi:FkbM family methyltransferase